MIADSNSKMTSYKELHENFMQNHNGTSIMENIMIITPAPIMVYFVCLLKFYLIQIYSQTKTSQFLIFILEFVLLVCFLVLHFTLLSNYIHICATSFIVGFIILLKYHFTNAKKDIFKITRKMNNIRPSFTYFRSIVSLMACICILAVDFHIFPRRFAKTETFGYGLMDTGVGFYIVANGIVYKPNNKREGILKSMISSIPIIILGIIRFISVEALDYQKHVSEYGVHWNFFFTLAFVKIIGGFLLFINPRRVVLMSVVTGCLHQFILFILAENWVLDSAPRSNYISANKEGLVSLLGYVSLYLHSAALGKFLNKPVLTLSDLLRHGINTFLWSFIFFVLTLCFYWMFNVSRRLANLTYITWIMNMSLFGISLCIFTEMALRISLPSKEENNETLIPNIFQAINYNSLFYFLLSNIFTGLINLTIHTFYAGEYFSIFVLGVYQLCACGILYLMFFKNIKLKFW